MLRKSSVLFLLVFTLISVLQLECYAKDGESQLNYVILGDADFVKDTESLLWTDRAVNSSSDDFKITLRDVHFTDGLMSFTIEEQTSVSASGLISSSNALYLNGETRAASGGVGIDPGPDVRTETYAWYNTPSVFGMDWESFRITYEDIFFTFSDDSHTVYIAPAENCNWSFVFHNPDVSTFNEDGFVPTVDEKGIHTLGNTFDIYFTGGIVSKGPAGEDDIYNFSIITKSGLLNHYGFQDSIWQNGIHRFSGGSSVEFDENDEPVLPADGKFTQSDHFEYHVPQTFSAAENSLTVWAGSVSFEITCTGKSVDPEMGYTWSWQDDLTDREGKSIFPMKLVQFNTANDRLPQVTDPVLFSHTADDVTMDIVGLDLVRIPRSRLYGNPNENGENTYFQVGLCFTLPDDGEWDIIPGTAAVGNLDLWADMMAAGGIEPASGNAQGRKCVQMRYNVSSLDPDWNQPVKLNFDSIAAIPREGSPCKDILHRFETNASAQALGVTVSCTDNVTGDVVRGPKDYVLTVESFDEVNRTLEEVESALERYLDFHVSGPWTFSIDNINSYIIK